MNEKQNRNEELVIRPKQLKGNDGYKVFSIRVRDELIEDIEDIAKRTGHSRNELIGMFLEYAIGHCRVEEA